MEFRYFDITGSRVATANYTLSSQEGIPHLTDTGGNATINVDAKNRTISFKQDGISNAYNNVEFSVDDNLNDFEFVFKRLSHGGCEFKASYKFARAAVSEIELVTAESVFSLDKEIIKANGYKIQ